VGAHDGFADRQTQTASAIDASARFVRPIKALENARQIFGGNADAGVGHGQNRRTLFDARADADFSVVFVVLDGVGEKVGDDLAEAVGIAEGFGGRKVAVDLNAALGR
jgi:hypothetical protein